jgi:hypothetical protein
MKPEVTKPKTATTSPNPAKTASPEGSAINTPPTMVPIKMLTKVPVSTKALPPTSSSSFKSSGRMLYLAGPKKVDWSPSRNNTTISRATDWV